MDDALGVGYTICYGIYYNPQMRHGGKFGVGGSFHARRLSMIQRAKPTANTIRRQEMEMEKIKKQKCSKGADRLREARRR